MKSTLFRLLKLLTVILISAGILGCASVTMPPPTASVDTLKVIRKAKLAPSSVGDFILASGLNPKVDKSLGGLRGVSLRSENGSFSKQLRDVVITELKAAGLYDEQSHLQIEAQLLESEVDAAISVGTAKLAANFTVDRAGERVFEKVLSVDAQWDSSFIGDIAVPEAISQYSSLYKMLVKKLFNDNDFQVALAR